MRKTIDSCSLPSEKNTILLCNGLLKKDYSITQWCREKDYPTMQRGREGPLWMETCHARCSAPRWQDGRMVEQSRLAFHALP